MRVPFGAEALPQSAAHVRFASRQVWGKVVPAALVFYLGLSNANPRLSLAVWLYTKNLLA